MEDRTLYKLKEKYRIPPEYQSCHTAIVDGYVLEGHVPKDEVLRLLEERPDILGLAVPGMPIGSPGMEVPGRAPAAYRVFAIGKDGKTSVYAEYPKK